jgi:long-subunit acyl-CoA synthetase (AMP-forming)
MKYQQVQKSLAGMKKYEIPRKWELLEEGFTKERGMMTPKMSVKRHIVMKVSSVSCMHDIPSTSYWSAYNSMSAFSSCYHYL